MVYAYPAIIHEGENGGLWTEFIDFDVYSQGDTLNDLITNAKEALICHIEDKLKNGEELPAATDIKSVETNDGFLTLISTDKDLDYQKFVERTIKIPYWLDKKAVAAGVNFSKTFQKALLASV